MAGIVRKRTHKQSNPDQHGDEGKPDIDTGRNPNPRTQYATGSTATLSDMDYRKPGVSQAPAAKNQQEKPEKPFALRPEDKKQNGCQT